MAITFLIVLIPLPGFGFSAWSENDASPPAVQPSSWARFGQNRVNLFDQGLRRNTESFGESEDHVEGRSANAFLLPGHVASFQSAEAGKVRLTPPFANTPLGDDLGKAGTEMVDFVQTGSLRDDRALVAVTIGPDGWRFELTLGHPWPQFGVYLASYTKIDRPVSL